jgi:hypothetical protein
MITVAHEALFRVWPEAAAWLTRNREFVRLRASVTESFARWQSAGEHESLLLPIGLPLDEAGRLSAIEAGRLEAPVRDYIEMSVARADALVENDRAQALAISERNSFLEQLNCAIRSTMFDALLLLRTERKVTTRERDPQYSDFLKVDASREQALTDLAMIDALLTGGGRWHPQAAEHRHSFGADGDYAEGWEFPCCGKKTVTFDERPNQISDSGCSAIISQASSQFRLSSQHVEVLWHGIEARLSRGVGIMTEVRYLDELLQLIQGQVKEEPALSQLNAVGDQIAARLTPLVPISIEKDVTRFHVWRREATCVYETLGEWASTRKQWQAAEAEFTRAYETAQSVEDHSPRSKADIDRTRNNLARVHQQRGQSA